MKILITGSKGFVGQNLVLSQLGQEHDLVTPSKRLYDFRLQSQTDELLRVCKPDAIIHLAATVGGIGANMKSPGRFMYDNLVMGTNLIEGARKYSVKNFIMLSTVCSYPKYTKVPFMEETIWDGYPEETNAPYGIAKKALAELLLAYKKQYNFNSCVLVPTNMYGPYDNFDENTSHVIPAIMKKVAHAIKHQEPSITVWGTGKATREFLYVDDCVQAITKAIDHTDPEPINVGTGQEVSIKELVTKICSIMQYKGDIVFDTSKPDGQPRRCLYVERAQRLLDFTATTSLDTGLKQTIDWYYDSGTAL